MESILNPNFSQSHYLLNHNSNQQHPYLGFSLKDGPLYFRYQCPVFSFRSDGIRRARLVLRNSESRQSINSDDNVKPRSSEGKSYNREEILALFRRIQSSIWRESTASRGKTHGPTAESVLEVLRLSREKMKGKISNLEGGTGSSEKKREQKKDKDQMLHQPLEKISRPASNFVKRSPIPSTYAERVVDEVQSARYEKELEMMKLAALKDLAKSRGVKGYSKLKKGGLINLLKTL
uniref:uncharacterized protein LOC122580957 isoform X2 n=1 Tax=Erigeron canadensis TaxID=72917 RepID=UPI001CB9C6B4|nr:uncharacterized protein LOC122580957 isoform X2 [Erigeron canadensis]